MIKEMQKNDNEENVLNYPLSQKLFKFLENGECLVLGRKITL